MSCLNLSDCVRIDIVKYSLSERRSERSLKRIMRSLHKAVGDTSLTGAILDRLLRNVHKLKLNGELKSESTRQLKSDLTKDEHLV
jgi:hypothetical protein